MAPVWSRSKMAASGATRANRARRASSPRCWRSPDGELLIGTFHGELVRFAGGRFTPAPAPPRPTPDSQSMRCSAIDEGALWVGTDDGLSRYHEEQWRTWRAQDGLGSDDVRHDRRAAATESIWIGGGLGVDALSRWALRFLRAGAGRAGRRSAGALRRSRRCAVDRHLRRRARALEGRPRHALWHVRRAARRERASHHRGRARRLLADRRSRHPSCEPPRADGDRERRAAAVLTSRSTTPRTA